MRHLYLLLTALLLVPTGSYAKGTGSSQSTSGVFVGGLFPHFNPNAGSATITSRLLSKTYTKYNKGFIPVDSTNYIYSTGRGGFTRIDDPNNDESINFDESYTYLYNPSAGLYDNRLHRQQQFDGNDKVTMLTYRVWKLSNAAWKDSSRYVYTYSADGKQMTSNVLQQWIQGGWNNSVPSILTYDTKNNVTQVSSVGYTASFTYDPDDNLTSLTDQVWDAGSSSLIYNTRKSYTYTTGKVATYKLEKWSAQTSGWVNIENWVYTYIGNNVETITEQHWNGAWVNYAKREYTYDGNNNKLSENIQIWDAGSSAYINSKRKTFEYNSYNQPTLITNYTWDNVSAWVFALNDEQLRLYYGYYSPTIVANTSKSESSLYPVPAVDKINLQIRWNTPQAFSISIIDMRGVVVRQWQESATMNYAKELNVSDMPAGNYVLRATGSNEQLTEKITVVH